MPCVPRQQIHVHSSSKVSLNNRGSLRAPRCIFAPAATRRARDAMMSAVQIRTRQLPSNLRLPCTQSRSDHILGNLESSNFLEC
jgi:hypothetical protein